MHEALREPVEAVPSIGLPSSALEASNVTHTRLLIMAMLRRAWQLLGIRNEPF